MSLIPMLFSNWWEELDRPHRIPDQNFGLGLHLDQLLPPSDMEMTLFSHPKRHLGHPLMYYRPWTIPHRDSDSGSSVVQADKDKFQVVLDVQQFEPKEIDLKVIDNYVLVNAKHEEKRDDHGWISRQFTRKYLIPEQCDLDQVKSKLSSDGVLTISVPRKDVAKGDNERVIKIEHTGKPALQPTPAKQPKKLAEQEKGKEKEK